MKLHHTIAGLGMSALLLFTGCSQSAAPKKDAATEEAPAVAEDAVDPSIPTPDTLVARSLERWELVVAADWIQAYDFLDPEFKHLQSLGQYIAGKEMHEYRNPSVPQLIGSEDNLGYLELSVLWEPHHPEIRVASNAPDDMTEELHMVEIWKWAEGDWYFSKSERANEFHAAHPGLGKGKAEDE